MPNELPRPVKEAKPVNKVKSVNEPKENEYDNIDAENTEHMLAYKTTMRLYGVFAKVYGITVDYSWRPKRSFMHWFTWVLLSCAWFSIIYTVYFHYARGNFKRILEPLAIGGISSSVIIIETSRITRKNEFEFFVFISRRLQ